MRTAEVFRLIQMVTAESDKPKKLNTGRETKYREGTKSLRAEEIKNSRVVKKELLSRRCKCFFCKLYRTSLGIADHVKAYRTNLNMSDQEEAYRTR